MEQASDLLEGWKNRGVLVTPKGQPHRAAAMPGKRRHAAALMLDGNGWAGPPSQGRDKVGGWESVVWWMGHILPSVGGPCQMTAFSYTTSAGQIDPWLSGID